MLGQARTLRPNPLRPGEAQFAIVCPKCPLVGYFHSEWAVLECQSQHTRHNVAVFVYSFLPTRHSAKGFTLHEHVWVELANSGEIELDVAG